MAESIILKAGGGADLDIITAVAGDILTGKVSVDRDGNQVNGAMANNGNHNASLNCGQSKAIPAGFTLGGTVTANSLASQTGGVTADDTKVLSGYTYWRDGAKRTGNMAVQSIINFRAALYSTRAIMLTWQNPARGPYSGVAITYRTDGRYPNSVGDGVNCYDGSATNALISNIPANVGVYFRAWSYMTTNQGRVYGGNLDAYAVASEIKGQQIFTSSGFFAVPDDVYKIECFCVGGGGGSLDVNSRYLSRGGGGGGYTTTTILNVTPGQRLDVAVGAGGASAYGGISNCGAASAKGGRAASSDSDEHGGPGGSGGGSAGFRYSSGVSKIPGAGGSDGSNGGPNGGGSRFGGDGQNTNTRAFGEPAGTLYAGGGGGAGSSSSDPGRNGAPGGAGGGGNGGTYSGKGKPGQANTGGGGGGGGWGASGTSSNGGSGIVIVRWGY